MENRKRKWGVWLSNQTSREDDEWVFVWAKDREEAYNLAKEECNSQRFNIRHVLPIKEFRQLYGNI